MPSTRHLVRAQALFPVLLSLASLSNVAPSARAQDDPPEDTPAEPIIPWDVPEDSDGVLEPHELDVRALAELFDSVSAPPPPIEVVHVGTFDAATGDFIWGPDVYLRRSFELVTDAMADLGAVFDALGIQDLHVDLAPHITTLASLGPGVAGATPRMRPAAGRSGRSSSPGAGATEPERLRGHPGEAGVMQTGVSAAKLALVFDVVNRPSGHAPFVVTVDGVTVQGTSNELDLVVPPRTRHDFTVSCGKAPAFGDRLGIARPPILGSFTLEALPVALVYEPPGGTGCSQTWSQTHRVGMEIRTFDVEETSDNDQPVPTPFSKVSDFIGVLEAVGSASKGSEDPNVAAVSGAVSGVAGALRAAWGSSHATETVTHSVSRNHTLSFELAESVSVTTTGGLGPGEGDLYYVLLKPTFAWVVVDDPKSARIFVTVTLLGYEGHATVDARTLRAHVLAQPAILAQDQLLALDPLAPEYVTPAARDFANVRPGELATRRGGRTLPERLLPLASPLIIVSGGQTTFSAVRTIQQEDLVETSEIRTTTTKEEKGLLSYVRSDVPQDMNRTVRLVGGRSSLTSVSDEVAVSVTLTSPSLEPLYLEVFYDRLFGTFAFRRFEPGMQSLSGSVSDGAGLPRPGQDVTVWLPDGRGLSLRTDEQGRFECRPPAAGKGVMSIESGGARARVEWGDASVAGVVLRGATATAATSGGGKPASRTTRLPDPASVPVKTSENDTAMAIRGRPAREEAELAALRTRVEAAEASVRALEARLGQLAAAPPAEERKTERKTGRSAPPADAAVAAVTPDPKLRGRLGHLAIAFAGAADVSSCRIDVLTAGPPEKSVASNYGQLGADLMPGTYAVMLSGRRVNGVEVRSGHETRVHLGVLRVTIGPGTRFDLYEPGAERPFFGTYGSDDVLLPPGPIEVEIAGQRDTAVVRRGEILEF